VTGLTWGSCFAWRRIHTGFAEGIFGEEPAIQFGGEISERVLLERKSGVAKKAMAPSSGVNAAGGSMFRDILRQIRRIPRGQVATYGDVAYAAGYPGAARQVAWALHGCGRTVPWQRVIGSGGKILCTGELGFEQRLRLQGEGVEFTGMRVRIEQHRFHFFGNKKGGKGKKNRAGKRNK
jgi:methylated-DNA-protein-cysteine methyltransferase-like protein